MTPERSELLLPKDKQDPRESVAGKRPECSNVALPGKGQAQLLEGVPVCAGCAGEAGVLKWFSLHFFDFSLSVSKVGC